MQPDAIEHMRRQLLRRRDELRTVGELAEAGTRVVELDQSRIGRLSRADALQSQAMSLEVKRRREQELQRIEAALQRIASGDFGICPRCDEPIESRRLEANPAAVLCIACAERGEGR